jgi:lichenan operon transcriptional antiterminator
MSDKYLTLLELLRSSDEWLTANFLADKMGVSTRSVRSYVTTAKSAAHPYDIISATSVGYRLNRDAYVSYRNALDAKPESIPSTPREREQHIVHRLASSATGLTIDDLAASLHVSSATIEADVKRIRQTASESGVAIDRVDNVLTLRGVEAQLRRLLSTLVHDTTSSGLLSLDTIAIRFDIPSLVSFKTDLIERLDYHRYFINEYGIDSVLLHLAIAVDRVRNGLTLPDDDIELDTETALVAGIVRALAKRHFDIDLGAREEWYLARQLATRIITPSSDGTSRTAHADAEDVALTTRAIELVYDEYLIDLRNDDLISRLALHIGHLVTRAQFDSPSRNPLQKSIKSSYPLVWDIAVFIASTIQKERDITIDEDEISYVALHIGSHLERQAQAKNRATATIVSPSYYDLHIVMRESIEKILGAEITIESVITRTDVRPSDITTDIVITTIPLDFALDSIVQVQPFLSESDIDNVRRVAARARRTRRRTVIRERLLEFFRPDMFFRNMDFDGPESAILTLGTSLMSLGIIDESYIESAIEREQMSSTIFVDGLAVPHAMSMTAERPTIALAVNETPTPWGDQRVNVIAFIAFAASGRDEFQTVFEQIVDVFSDRGHMNEVIKNSSTFEGFIDTLVHIIDD